jgi:1-aminocyclopropane-1-carboxylate deaminase
VKLDFKAARIEPLKLGWAAACGLQVDVKREDLVHPYYGGNKWRKLKYVILAALKKQGIISCGGAYSNHLLALAAYGKEVGLETIGIVRGGEVETELLKECKSLGMKLVPMDRNQYRQLRENQKLDWKSLGLEEEEWLWVGEGGKHPLAFKGVAEMVEEIEECYDYIAVACGTGVTLAGMVQGVKGKKTKLLGFPVLKEGEFLLEELDEWVGREERQKKNSVV